MRESRLVIALGNLRRHEGKSRGKATLSEPPLLSVPLRETNTSRGKAMRESNEGKQ